MKSFLANKLNNTDCSLNVGKQMIMELVAIDEKLYWNVMLNMNYSNHMNRMIGSYRVIHLDSIVPIY
ncbi:hypothetical protein BLA29_014439 [Euroglyphus maynei]|uniref:Uncharacterized protein n=1 Tax=Euroglyphus maynei TaxID=6958 RepID=A0A1Y3BVD3_EURMA|nr:hypothetical protein BLA29_014439 [Euroglyphus maynei]